MTLNDTQSSSRHRGWEQDQYFGSDTDRNKNVPPPQIEVDGKIMTLRRRRYVLLGDGDGIQTQEAEKKILVSKS